MSNHKDIVYLSESEIDGETVEVAIKQSIKDLQQGLCHVETHLLNMIDSNEIDGKMWLASHECNVELLNLIKELISICKEIKPSGKALKVAREEIKEHIDVTNALGQNN